MKYDIVLKEAEDFLDGLTENDVIDLFKKLNGTEAYPIELCNYEQTYRAIGFISKEAAGNLWFDYDNILNEMVKESKDCVYSFRDLKIWLCK